MAVDRQGLRPRALQAPLLQQRQPSRAVRHHLVTLPARRRDHPPVDLPSRYQGVLGL